MIRIIIVSILLFISSDVAIAQTPNKARRKPVKKVMPKPTPPPAPVVEVVKEPTLEETKTWILEKILKYKPIVYITSSLANKNNCEYLVTAASFDSNDQLILHVKADAASTCYKDQLQTITINFSQIDVKRTNTVESTKRVLLFPQTLTKPFTLQFAANSAMLKTNFTQFNTIIAFDKGATYEPNLASRLGKSFLKMYDFKNTVPAEKEAY